MNEYLDELVINGKIYTDIMPVSISNAIYLYGDNDIKTIIAYIELADDGSQGLIITDQALYYYFSHSVKIAYKDIEALILNKQRNHYSIKIKANHRNYQLEDLPIRVEVLLNILSSLSNKDITYDLTLHETISYNVSVVLKDLENDEYEDIELNDDQQEQIKEFKETLELIKDYDERDYQYELECLCPKALKFFDELELDSDEIDALIEAQKQLESKDEKAEQMFRQAKNYYDDMMNNYNHGDTTMYDNLNRTLNNMGFDIGDLKNKSPEELEQYINEVCERFHISRSQLEKVANKFRN